LRIPDAVSLVDRGTFVAGFDEDQALDVVDGNKDPFCHFMFKLENDPNGLVEGMSRPKMSKNQPPTCEAR